MAENSVIPIKNSLASIEFTGEQAIHFPRQLRVKVDSNKQKVFV